MTSPSRRTGHSHQRAARLGDAHNRGDREHVGFGCQLLCLERVACGLLGKLLSRHLLARCAMRVSLRFERDACRVVKLGLGANAPDAM